MRRYCISHRSSQHLRSWEGARLAHVIRIVVIITIFAAKAVSPELPLCTFCRALAQCSTQLAPRRTACLLMLLRARPSCYRAR
jgi:hypothetical protein